MPSKKSEQPEGAPMWIVTFSDLMSLLLTFFVLLLSFSTISEEDFQKAMMSLQGALGLLEYPPSAVPPPLPVPPRRDTEEAAESSRRLRRRRDVAVSLQRQLQIRGIERRVKVDYDAVGGLKITLPSQFLFQPGSAELRPESFGAFSDIAAVLKELPEAFIEVRGHTDASPVGPGSPFRDNFQLSYARADAVARRLYTEGGVPEDQFEITAVGPNQPVATNDTEAGREANRRVEIQVRGLVNENRLDSLREQGVLPPGGPFSGGPASPADS